MMINNNEYFEVLNNIKQQIRNAQYRAVLSVNQEQIILYWKIDIKIRRNLLKSPPFIISHKTLSNNKI